MAHDDAWRQWERDTLTRLATAVRRTRERRGYSQAELASLVGISRGVLANLESAAGESPRVQEVPSVATVIRLALALGAPPLELIYPDLPDGPVEVWPGREVTSFQAVQWFSGEISANEIEPDSVPADSNERLRLSRERARVRELIAGMGDALFSASVRSDAEKRLRDTAVEAIAQVSRGIAELQSLLAQGGWMWGAGGHDVAAIEHRMRRAGMVVDDGGDSR